MAFTDEQNEQIRNDLIREAQRCGGTLKIHIKVDTGMSRLGYLVSGDHFKSGVEGICEACCPPGLEAEGIFTHFAVSDEPENEESRAYTKQQFDLFTSVIEKAEEKLGRKFALRREQAGAPGIH